MFSALGEGTYQIAVSADGYASRTVQLTITGDQQATQDIALSLSPQAGVFSVNDGSEETKQQIDKVAIDSKGGGAYIYYTSTMLRC